MKKILILLAVLLIPLAVFAAWSAADNFDSYTVGSSLNTLNGGSGFSGAWSEAGGVNDYTIQTAPSGGQGGNAARYAGGTFTQDDRSFSPISAGTLSIMGEITLTNPSDVCSVRLRSGATGVISLWFDPSGNIYTGTGPTSLGAYSANTWYTFLIEFDDSAQPDKYRVTINGGAPSAWMNTDNAYSSIDTLRIDGWFNNALQYCYWDAIQNGAAPAPSTITNSILSLIRSFWIL